MKSILTIAVFLFSWAAGASAQNTSKPILPKYLQGVGIDQRLNAQVPLATQFVDESGDQVKLGDLLGHNGDHGVRLAAVIAAGCAAVTAVLTVHFLTRYFKRGTLTPFGIYCLLFRRCR